MAAKKEELKDCHSKVDETLQSLKEAKEHGAEIEKQLRDDNDALTVSLQKCHKRRNLINATIFLVRDF